MTLVTCTACERHIRRSETQCPFCGVTVAACVTTAPERPLPTMRLSRAALVAFAASYVGAGCGGQTIEERRTDGGGATAGSPASGGATTTGTGGLQLGSGGYNVAPIYGLPATGAYPGSGGYSNVLPPYGLPAFGGFQQSGGSSSFGGAAGGGGAGNGGSGETDGGARDGSADADVDAAERAKR